jgi:hypothetical protein
MLRDPNLSEVISWEVPTQDESDCMGGGFQGIGKIVCHQPEALQEFLLDKYYRHSKYALFQHQLHRFGFKKRVHGGKKGKFRPCSYVHEGLDGNVESLLTLKRRPRVKKRVSVDISMNDSSSASVSSMEEVAERPKKRRNSVQAEEYAAQSLTSSINASAATSFAVRTPQSLPHGHGTCVQDASIASQNHNIYREPPHVLPRTYRQFSIIHGMRHDKPLKQRGDLRFPLSQLTLRRSSSTSTNQMYIQVLHQSNMNDDRSYREPKLQQTASKEPSPVSLYKDILRFIGAIDILTESRFGVKYSELIDIVKDEICDIDRELEILMGKRTAICSIDGELEALEVRRDAINTRLLSKLVVRRRVGKSEKSSHSDHKSAAIEHHASVPNQVRNDLSSEYKTEEENKWIYSPFESERKDKPTRLDPNSSESVAQREEDGPISEPSPSEAVPERKEDKPQDKPHAHTKPRCKVNGCTNQCIQGGRCYLHGARRKKCDVPGCTNTVWTKCKYCAPRYLKPECPGKFREEEDAIILRAIAQSCESTFTQWTDLAPQLPGRSGKQIRDRG